MTNAPVRQDEDVQAGPLSLFLQAAPERKSELEALWLQLAPRFQLTPDTHEGERIILDAGAFRYVRYNHRVTRAFWIAGYAAWEAYRAASLAPSLDRIDLSRFQGYLAAFELTLSTDDYRLEALPPGIPEPGSFPNASIDPEERAAGELAMLGVAWAFLHEIRHIRHQQEGTGATANGNDRAARYIEEFSCDAFGVNFLLEQLDAYSASTREPVETVRSKRQLGIYFGLFALTLMTKDHWGDSETHPAAQRRIDAVQALMSPASDMASAMAHAAFAGLGSLWPKAPRFPNAQQAS